MKLFFFLLNLFAVSTVTLVKTVGRQTWATRTSIDFYRFYRAFEIFGRETRAKPEKQQRSSFLAIIEPLVEKNLPTDRGKRFSQNTFVDLTTEVPE